MIVNFDLNKILYLYKTETLDPLFVDQNGERHVDKWIAFALELIRMSQAAKVPNRATFSYVDRTRSMPSIVKTHIPDDQIIPVGPPSSLDYLDICLARAQALLDTNKHINILWSGGIDSTVALFSLLRQAKNLDQISIICTFESILESGRLFDSKIIKTGVRVKFDQTRNERKSPFSFDYEDTTQLYVTGQCGDQLFAPLRVYMFRPNSNHQDHWYDSFSRDILDIVEPSLPHSVRPIETIRDMRWWLLFNYTWTTVLYDDCVGRPADVGSRIMSFYATPDFQRWSIHTPTYYDHVNQYRWPAKKALAQLVDYNYFIDNKEKVLSYTWIKDPSWYMLDKNFVSYYQG